MTTLKDYLRVHSDTVEPEDGFIRFRGIDTIHGVSTDKPPLNYSTAYAGDPTSKMGVLTHQDAFLRRIGVPDNTPKILQCPNHGSTILRVDGENLLDISGYDERLLTRSPDHDASYTFIPNVALAAGYSDCPQLIVVGDNVVGIVHASRDTLDKDIIKRFFKEVSSSGVNLGEIEILIPPRIGPENFLHSYLGMNRADEWASKGFIRESTRSAELGHTNYEVDLIGIILDDLEVLGVSPSQVYDSGIDSYEFCQFLSGHQRGVVYSHRLFNDRYQGSNQGMKEGRGLLAVMRQN